VVRSGGERARSSPGGPERIAPRLPGTDRFSPGSVMRPAGRENTAQAVLPAAVSCTLIEASRLRRALFGSGRCGCWRSGRTHEDRTTGAKSPLTQVVSKRRKCNRCFEMLANSSGHWRLWQRRIYGEVHSALRLLIHRHAKCSVFIVHSHHTCCGKVVHRRRKWRPLATRMVRLQNYFVTVPRQALFLRHADLTLRTPSDIVVIAWHPSPSRPVKAAAVAVFAWVRERSQKRSLFRCHSDPPQANGRVGFLLP